MTTEGTQQTNLSHARLQHQLAAIVRCEWIQWRVSWQEGIRQNIISLVIVAMLIVLPLWLIIGGLLAVLSDQFVLNILPAVFTIAFLLLFCIQALQIPNHLWNAPDLEWLLIAPVPRVVVLTRPLLLLLRGSLLPVIVVLIGASILALFLHSSPTLLLLLWLVGLNEAVLCPLVVLVGTLALAWALGRVRAQAVVVIVAVIMGFPTLLMLFSLFVPGFNIQGLPLLHWLEEPARFILTTSWILLTQPASLALLQFALLIGAFLLLPPVLVLCYIWLGKSIFQRVWEGLQQEGGQQRFSAETRPQLLWQLAWHFPGLTPGRMALIGFCWQDTVRNWADLPNIIVTLLIAFVVQVPLFLDPGSISIARDFLPLIAPLFILVENQIILLTIGKSLMHRLLQARDLLCSTPATATDIFLAINIALYIPVLLCWSVLILGAGLLLGMALRPLIIMAGTFILGLGACTPLALCGGIFSTRTRRGYRFDIVLAVWLFTLLIAICLMVITTQLIIPTLSPAEKDALYQLRIPVTAISSFSWQSALLFLSCILIGAGLVVLAGYIGIAGLRRKMRPA